MKYYKFILYSIRYYYTYLRRRFLLIYFLLLHLKIKYYYEQDDVVRVNSYIHFSVLLQKVWVKSTSVEDFIFFFDGLAIPKVNMYRYERMHFCHNIFRLILIFYSMENITSPKNEKFIIDLYEKFIQFYSLDPFSAEDESCKIFYYCESYYTYEVKEFLLDVHSYRLRKKISDKYFIL